MDENKDMEDSKLQELFAYADSLAKNKPPGEHGPIEFACYSADGSSARALREALGGFTTYLQHYPRVGVVAASSVLVGFAPRVDLGREALRTWVREIWELAQAHGCILDGFDLVSPERLSQETPSLG